MKLVDANVLLYAIDKSSRRHKAARHWLDGALGGNETVLLPWVSLLAFIRLATNPSIFPSPLSTDQALDIVELWLQQPAALAPEPDHRQVQRMRELLAATGRGGNLVNDAFLASLALAHGAQVVTFDNDFGRFPGVEWFCPSD